MKVSQFMSEKTDDITRIINQLPRPFDSHAFIQKLSREFQVEYVQLLSQYDQDPFIKVHNQIGRYLADNQLKFGIRAEGKVVSANIFGEENSNENWM